MEHYFDLGTGVLPAELRKSTAEISRLAISKHRLRLSKAIQKGAGSARPPIVLGLFKSMYQESKRLKLTHWLAAMEDSLARMLQRYHMPFEPVGPEVDYYGRVRPYLARIADIETNVAASCPEFFSQFLDGLEPEHRPHLAPDWQRISGADAESEPTAIKVRARRTLTGS